MTQALKIETMGNAQVLGSQLDLLINSVRAEVEDSTYLNGLDRVKNQLIGIVTEYTEKRAGILADIDYTEQARRRKIADVRKDALEKLDNIKDLGERADQLSLQLFSQPDQKSETAQLLQYMREKEVRESLETADNVQIVAWLEEIMIEDPENLLLDACINAPDPRKQYLSDDDKKRFLRMRAMARNPRLSAELADVECINSAIQALKNIALDHLKA
mgnify:CR=1 FL=1